MDEMKQKLMGASTELYQQYRLMDERLVLVTARDVNIDGVLLD